MYLYNVEGFKVIAPTPYEAKKLLGQYFDLPFSWWSVRQATLVGITSRVSLTGQEISHLKLEQEKEFWSKAA